METSIESKFSAAFEQQNSKSSKAHLCNGTNKKSSSSSTSTAGNTAAATTTTTTTTTTNTESSGEKSFRFCKGNDLESFEALSSLFANGLFTDLVICCAGKMFKCHRVVLAAASLYVRDALSAFYNNEPESSSGCNHCNTVMILPKEIKVTDMEAILHFIYDGQVEVKVDHIDSFLKSARTLNIKGLSNLNIVFNNNGTASTTEESPNESVDDLSIRKNNGYQKNHNSILTNGHTGMNSPPPSPPSLNSSLASLKAMAGNSPSQQNGNHISSRLLNGALSSQLINQFRNSIRDESPLRNDPASILGHNLTPAHQSSLPKNVFSNGSVFNNNVLHDSTNSSSGGSRRKQRFPHNIPSLLTEMLPTAAAAALYNSWFNNYSEEDDEEGDDIEDEKKLVIKDDSSNDCSTAGDNLSTASLDTSKQLPFGVQFGAYNPQVPCMIEVEADPTTFPTYQDLNDSSHATPLLQPANKRRRQFKSPYLGDKVSQLHNKRLKMPYSGHNSNSTLDMSLKPASPLVSNSSQSSPAELLSKKHGLHASLTGDKPLYTTYSAAKKEANSSASSPAATSPSASNNWASNKWKCDICNKYYGNKQTLKEHMDYFHSNREEQIYICSICHKEYTWRKSLMKHYRDIHQMRNTPELAEINRQLAAQASAKVRNAVANISAQSNSSSNDFNLQSFVSIANFANQKFNPSGSIKSSSSEKSNKSEYGEMENENTDDVDSVTEQQQHRTGGDGGATVEEADDGGHDDTMDSSSKGGHEESVNGDSKCDSTPEKDTSSNVGGDRSPASSSS